VRTIASKSRRVRRDNQDSSEDAGSKCVTSMLVSQTRRIERRVRRDNHDIDGEVGGEDRPWQRVMNDKPKK